MISGRYRRLSLFAQPDISPSPIHKSISVGYVSEELNSEMEKRGYKSR